MFLVGITTIIFILSTTLVILGTGLVSQGLPVIIKVLEPSFDHVWSLHKMRIVGAIMGVIAKLNPVLSDVVFAWRAIVLWKYDRRVVTILSICVLGTFAASIYDLKLLLQSHPTAQGSQILLRLDRKVRAIFVGPILCTNLLSTSLIAWKAWDYHRTVGPHIRKGRPSGRVEKVLMLLIESDIVYCILWMFYLLTAFGILPGTGTYIVNMVMLYISSTYPVSVNVLAVTTQPYEFSEVWVQSVQ